MSSYRFIILDEVHERSMEFDMTLMLLKQFIYTNYQEKKCPFLILTSATFDVPKYAKYLGVDVKTNTMSVLGSVYGITETYIKTNSMNINNQAINFVKDIHEEKINITIQGENDILIFVYGSAPAKEIKTLLLKYNVELIKRKENTICNFCYRIHSCKI